MAQRIVSTFLLHSFVSFRLISGALILFYSILLVVCVFVCVCEECAFASLAAYTFSFRRSKFGVFNASMFFWPLFVFLLFFFLFLFGWFAAPVQSIPTFQLTHSMGIFVSRIKKKKHSVDFILDALIQLHKCA